MLTVTTPATARDLTTVEAIKDELGLPSTDTTNDFLFAELIERATAAILTYTGKEFAKQTYQETLAGHGGNVLSLSRAPIVSVTSVAFRGEPVVDFTVEDAEAGILYRDFGWYDTATGAGALDWHPNPRGDRLDYKVIYVAGYVLPGQDGRTLPRDLEKGCIELVKWYRDTKGGGDIGRVQSKSIGDASITYFDESAQGPDLPRHIAVLLRPWVAVF